MVCKIADRSVIDDANTLGKTRATMAMQHSIAEMKDGIVVIGNAPTALYELIDLIKRISPTSPGDRHPGWLCGSS